MNSLGPVPGASQQRSDLLSAVQWHKQERGDGFSVLSFSVGLSTTDSIFTRYESSVLWRSPGPRDTVFEVKDSETEVQQTAISF